MWKKRSWTEEEFAKQKKAYERQKDIFEKERELHELRSSMRRWKPPTTTKLLMAFILLNCTVVEVYSMLAMWMLMDLSSLYALITAVISESLSFAIYAAKSYNETKQEELIKLQREQMLLGQTVCESEEPNNVLNSEMIGMEEAK